ncbi:hypothetical protein M441DRAFT_306243 [Trichoderma asperellum CBS 433.97]|uniref:Uncharacterized protein n=1 Tax=Trichoderma asperellum (strain ATCC 204424 / CBS 433.97 / NBRC 101777) TaxID=1042311 RepID=A0A2T3ZJW2_TRIA4|nr:hypothetical protein M441DRAFT_306243 [Trichoderma asperellum CBS 433.97]PTB45095.1 hypothetical protein M441DRAFT_306243 [Trichoderma asperellum CBS 433.97]
MASRRCWANLFSFLPLTFVFFFLSLSFFFSFAFFLFLGLSGHFVIEFFFFFFSLFLSFLVFFFLPFFLPVLFDGEGVRDELQKRVCFFESLEFLLLLV